MPTNIVKVRVQPELLSWARTSSGVELDDAAKTLHVKEEIVESWEKRESEISVPRLRELANLYKRPLAIFFLASPPDEPALPHDFRTLPVEGTDGNIVYSKKTLLAIRRATRIQELSSELSKAVEYDLHSEIESTNLNIHPEALAEKIRTKLGISMEEQFKWKDENEALANWKSAIERRGILVLELRMNMKEARGFSLYGEKGKPPVIAISYGDAVCAKIFSLFHEYAHLILNESGIKSMRGRELKFDERVGAIEKFCNRFAASFLVPKNDLIKDELVKRNLPNYVWSNEVLSALGRKFKVSRETILRRLLAFDLTTEKFYKEMREEWSNIEANKKPRKGGKRNMPKEAFRENGKVFTSLVLEGNSRGRLSYGDVADYLQIKLKYLPQLSSMVSDAMK